MAEKSFEQSLKQLEQIVEELEKGDVPLEKALRKFEDGIKLSKYCSKKLDETEKRIALLIKEQDGKTVETPFIPDEE